MSPTNESPGWMHPQSFFDQATGVAANGGLEFFAQPNPRPKIALAKASGACSSRSQRSVPSATRECKSKRESMSEADQFVAHVPHQPSDPLDQEESNPSDHDQHAMKPPSHWRALALIVVWA